MRIRTPELPEDASTEDRFIAIARGVVSTSPAEIAKREAAHEASKAERGVKKRGPAKGTTPKHKRNGEFG